jgi:hypothetical protein
MSRPAGVGSSIGSAVWLIGRTPRLGTLLLAAAVGGLLAAAVIVVDDSHWLIRAVGAVLAFDVGAGLVSNASASTHAQWVASSRRLQVGFVVVHLTIYPLVLLLLVDDRMLGWSLVALLLAKTMLFARVFRA